MGNFEESTSIGLQESQTQVESGSTGDEGRATCSIPVPHGRLPSHTLRARHNASPKIQRRKSCSGETTSKTTVGCRAVFTEQGASASQTAARFLGTLSRHRGMNGEAMDAVSAHTQVHMSEAPRLLRFSEKRTPTNVDNTATQSKTSPLGTD